MRRILYICGTDPAKTRTGSEQRTHHLCEALKRLGEVTVVCTSGAGGMPEDARHICRRIERTPLFARCVNFVVRRLLRAVSPSALNVRVFPWEIARTVLREPFDLVVVRYLHACAEAHPWRYGPTYADIDDHPLELFDTLDAPAMASWRRGLARYVQRRLVQWVAAHLAGCWVANAERRRWVRGVPVLPLPNIPVRPSARYRADRRDRGGYLMTVGVMSYPPNRDGVERFLADIWPTLHAAYPALEYRIGGYGLPAEVASRWAALPGVRYIGYVEDLEALYEEALAAVVPIDAGSGTCVKAIEALAFGRVCLSTAFGARGLSAAADAGRGLFVYRTADEALSALRQVMSEPSRRVLEASAAACAASSFSRAAFDRAVRALVAGERGTEAAG